MCWRRRRGRGSCNGFRSRNEFEATTRISIPSFLASPDVLVTRRPSFLSATLPRAEPPPIVILLLDLYHLTLGQVQFTLLTLEVVNRLVHVLGGSRRGGRWWRRRRRRSSAKVGRHRRRFRDPVRTHCRCSRSRSGFDCAWSRGCAQYRRRRRLGCTGKRSGSGTCRRSGLQYR